LDQATIDAQIKNMMKPLETFEQFQKATSDADVNPNYIKPRMFMMRLQKIMDEYAGGVSAQFTTNKPSLERALELLAFLKEDSEKLAAADAHELMRCWENIHRMWQAEAHVHTVLFREETRWPGYYFRADTPKLDDEKWHVFANCRCDPKSGKWEVFTRPIIRIFETKAATAGAD
jgi:adenylylsulfate reductase subunit A